MYIWGGVLNSDVVVKLVRTSYDVHFRINTLRKDMNTLIFPAMG